MVGLAATGAYVIGRAYAPELAQTMAFATIALAELVLVFSIRSTVTPAWRGPRNTVLVASVFGSVVILALTIYLSPLQAPFGTAELGGVELAIVLLLALLPSLFIEVAKAARRNRETVTAVTNDTREAQA